MLAKWTSLSGHTVHLMHSMPVSSKWTRLNGHTVHFTCSLFSQLCSLTDLFTESNRENHGTYIRWQLRNRCACKRNLCYLFSVRHLTRSRVMTNWIFFSEKTYFPACVRTCSELPSNKSAMELIREKMPISYVVYTEEGQNTK